MLKILLIDDDPCVRLWSERILTNAGYSIITAGDSKSGLNLALQERPNLILLDMHMPKRNGLETLKTLKQSRYTRNIPVVMFTADDLVSSMDQALELGADGYIPKLNSSVTLQESIQRIFMRGPLDESMANMHTSFLSYH